MTRPAVFLWVVCLSFLITFNLQVNAQGTPPPDKPVAMTKADIKKFEKAIAPYVKKAKATLPQAKGRFLKGLPTGEEFFVTIRLFDPDGKFEQVFVRVTSWEGQTIKGKLSTEMAILKTHKVGEEVICKETEVLDWLISKPDGSEEGNFVGKFLDTYKP